MYCLFGRENSNMCMINLGHANSHDWMGNHVFLYATQTFFALFLLFLDVGYADLRDFEHGNHFLHGDHGRGLAPQTTEIPIDKYEESQNRAAQN